MKRVFTSCFGLGRLPVAPGTWGSLPPAVLFGVVSFFGVSLLWMSVLMAVVAVMGCVICIRFGPAVVEATGLNDPGEVVADEVAGQALTFMVCAFFWQEVLTGWQPAVTAAVGFLLFRINDIVKPWPIRKLEKFPGGWGILLDDLAAGVVAAIELLACLLLWIIA